MPTPVPPNTLDMTVPAAAVECMSDMVPGA